MFRFWSCGHYAATLLAAVSAVGSLILASPGVAEAVPVGDNVNSLSLEWSVFPNAGPTRTVFATAWDTQRNRMLVFGGHPVAWNDVWELDPSTPDWREIATSDPRPAPRYGASAIYDPISDRLVIYGGWTGGNTFDDVWALSLSEDPPTWTQLTPSGSAPRSRSYHAAVYDPANHRMVMFGGSGVPEFPTFMNDTWTLSLDSTPTWTQVATGGAPPGRNLMTGIYDSARGRMIIYGGWSGTIYREDTWALDLTSTPAWSQLPTSGPGPRREYVAVHDPVHDRVVLFGGFTGFDQKDPESRLKDLWQLNLATNQWQFLQTAPLPVTRRSGAGAVYDPVGQQMIVHGGYGGNTVRSLAYLNQTLAVSLSGSTADVGSAAPLALGLMRVHPNPSTGPLTLSFTLPSDAPATLELLDLAGRAVLRRDIGGLGPGSHSLELGRQERLPAGIYFATISQAGNRQYRRVSIVR